MEIKVINIKKNETDNIIIGQAHFIKTVEDLYEVLITAMVDIKFGLAFSEASGACLVRSEGNDNELKKLAEENALNVGAGHAFYILLRDAYPINVLNAVKNTQEVCRVFCATANPLEVLVAESKLGRGIVGVIDGSSPRSVETEEDIRWRKDLLRKIGYKRS